MSRTIDDSSPHANRDRGGGGIVLIAVIVLLVAYVLSPFLIGFLEAANMVPEFLEKPLEVFFFPLGFLYEKVSAVKWFYDTLSRVSGIRI